ncbi:PP2C family serine/threonine-protein phosphatase [Aureibacillus halotolerans]|uniref:Negative regulator of sigma-B (Phosphoserine phosphatase) n=1 Tax=Aureibacillus halotolerans TaxID=1508390 RepID=A0A4R6TXV7_9BACI|nr:PP2C family serine/threonine-protein phosphatase [Aureibacillus halotolerans]TDQ36715.1 negative regulator of sigma-B (phosphoserine phosphatase) [Aureibacillus halotolerans]
MKKNQQLRRMDVFSFQRAKGGQETCGDSFFFEETEDYFVCALADGLGSGVDANKASHAAISEIRSHHALENIEQLFLRANHAMKDKRGAVLTVFFVDYVKKELTCASIGNIRLFFHSATGKLTYPLPQSGYLSGRPQKLKIQTFPCEQGSTFLIHSDGLELRSPRNVGWQLKSTKSAFEQLATSIEEKPTDDVTYLIGTFAR